MKKILLFVCLSSCSLYAKEPVFQSEIQDLIDQSKGEGVFLVADAKGIVARSAEKELKVLSKEKGAVAYHQSLDLIWLLNGDKVSTIDLRTKELKPQVLVEKIKLDHFMGFKGLIDQDIKKANGLGKIYLQWSEDPVLSTESDDEEAFNPDLLEKDIEHAEYTGEKWLISALKRDTRKVAVAQEAPKVEGKCEECGDAVKIDDHLTLFVSKISGDDTHFCTVVDQSQKKNVIEDSSCGPYYVDAKNHYAFNDINGTKEQYKICNKQSHQCKSFDGKILGLLNPEAIADLDSF